MKLVPRNLLRAFANAHVDVAPPRGADGAAGVLVHHEAAIVSCRSAGSGGNRHIQKRWHGSWVNLVIGGNRRKRRDRNIKRAKRAAGTFCEENVALIDLEVFIHHFRMIREKRAQSAKGE